MDVAREAGDRLREQPGRDRSVRRVRIEERGERHSRQRAQHQRGERDIARERAGPAIGAPRLTRAHLSRAGDYAAAREAPVSQA
jgi:hypothetical protein